MIILWKCAVFLYILVNCCSAKSIGNLATENLVKNSCGYESCPTLDSNMLNVHIVSHTHDDVGWLKTVDQYYYGSQTLIQKAGVQYIIDSVIQELLKDPKKKFIYVESAFFFMWWNEQDEKFQNQVKQLVNEGRLVFTGGAWSMNDEATTHYQSTIDQFSWGLRKLNDTFGECGRPRIGWQIDPFGHSREMASIFAQMGYDGLFFGRLDYQDKKQRLNTKTAEMIWHGSENLGEKSDLFTGVLYNNYQPPPGFCFDILCADEPIIDGKSSSDNNVEIRILDFFKYVNKMSNVYRTRNVLITMGEDFNYQDANMWYKNLDKLIKYSNEKQKNGSDINVFYSTPACYLKSLYDANITWPTKSDDFFPYASDPNAFWTGYFSSRPTLKRYERVGNHFLQICKQLTALQIHDKEKFESNLNTLREVMGVMQHHDAITGTEKQKVAYDYAKQLDKGLQACASNTKSILNRLVSDQSKRNENKDNSKFTYEFDFETCQLLNISLCEISEENKTFMVTLYNPLAHSVFQYVRIPVSDENYEIKDYRNVLVPFQLVPVPSPVKNLPFRFTTTSYELVFLANALPPMGYKSYYVQQIPKERKNSISKSKTNEDGFTAPSSKVNEIVIGNKYLNLTFDSNGLLNEIFSNGIQMKISQEFLYYEGAIGNNKEFRNRSSGAYIFRPNSTAKSISEKAEIQVVHGDLVDEVHQKFNEWISQVIRVYKAENWVEFEWLVGPIPIDDGIGKEIITKFRSEIKSNGTFYTDSNGREMLKRIRNHRDTWKLDLQEKVSGNYYPITTKIAIEDDETRLAVLVDRAQGASSLDDGSIEIMIHRRLLHDDAFGVGEALNETAFGQGLVARGHHYLLVGPKKSKSPTIVAEERFLQVKKLLPSWLFFSSTNNSYNDWRVNYNHIYSAIALSLPQNIHFMTLEPWHENELLIRFEHLLEIDEDPEYSKSVIFDLNDVLKNPKIIDIQETSLDGNEWLEQVERFKFKTDPKQIISDKNVLEKMIKTNLIDVPKIEISNNSINDKDKFKIELKPMQIRTFILTIEVPI